MDGRFVIIGILILILGLLCFTVRKPLAKVGANMWPAVFPGLKKEKVERFNLIYALVFWLECLPHWTRNLMAGLDRWSSSTRVVSQPPTTLANETQP